jgi:FkbM family methyltransferase
MYIKDLIYDVGMHNGDDTAYYLSRGYRVISIEADSGLVEKGKIRFVDQLKNQNLTIINAGIHFEKGMFDFYINEVHNEWNSFDKSIANRDGLPYHTAKVPCYPFGEILEQYGVPYYLKVDIEGHDYLCIQGLDQKNLPKYISIEGNHIDLLQSLAAKGFKKFKLIFQYNLAQLDLPPNKFWSRWLWSLKLRQWNSFLMKVFRKLGGNHIIFWFDRFSVPFKSRNFSKGSSGNFGESLEGEWYELEEAKNIYQYYQNEYQKISGNKDYGFWVDIHATW